MKRLCEYSLFYHIFFCVVFLQASLFGEGFIAGTVVKTADGFEPIEAIAAGDQVVCRDHAGVLVERCVVATCVGASQRQIMLITETATVVADEHQLFKVIPNCWVPARDIRIGDHLVASRGAVRVQKLDIIEQPVRVYTLSVDGYHNFLISEDQLVVHNMLEAVVVASTAPVALEVACKVAFGVGAVAGWVYTFWWGGAAVKSFQQKKDGSNGGGGQPCQCGHACGAGCNYGCSCGCGRSNSNNSPQQLGETHAHGKYVGVEYHNQNSRGNGKNGKSPAPIDGQKALDNSIQIDKDSPRRIGVSCGQIVVLSRTSSGEFHGHVIALDELIRTDHFAGLVEKMKRAGLLDRKGNPLK